MWRLSRVTAMPSMHRYSDETEQLANDIMRVALDRLRMEPRWTGRRHRNRWPGERVDTITAAGLGGDAALRLWTDVLAPATMSVDHPRYLAFIPGAPTEASTLFDLLVAASSLYGGTWLEGSGAVYAENQALRWVADLAGLPGRGRRLLRPGRHGRQPVGPGRRPPRRARSDAAARARPAGGGVHRRDALVGRVRAARVMDVDLLDGAGRRARPA